MAQTPITKDVWLNFKAIAVGDKFLVYLEDIKIMDVVDDNGLLSSGNFGFTMSSQAFDNIYEKAAVEIDDVMIYEVNESNYLCTP